jgi:hypothetical protein
MTYETIFTTSCSDCGQIDLAADQLWLVLPSRGEAHYDFYCPDCGQHVQHVLDEDAFDILAPLVAVEEIDVPAEVLETRGGPALTVDDLIDFMLALESA